MPADKDLLLQDEGPQRLGTSEVEIQLSSLLVAHQDTGLDAPLKEAYDLCSYTMSRIRPGSDVARPSERILYGDILHASFLRTEDLDILHEAISYYEGVIVSDSILSRRLALGHGIALATLYDHVTSITHAEKAIQHLNSVTVEGARDELAAQALCYLTPLMIHIIWDGESPSAIASDYTSRLDEVLMEPWRPYLRIKLLLTRALVAARLSFLRSDLKIVEDWHQFARAALNACPSDHFLLAEAYSRLAAMHDWRHQLVGNIQDSEQATLLATNGLEIRSLAPSIRCTLLNTNARSLGIQSQVKGDLNLLEGAIKLSREAFYLCRSTHRRYHEHLNGLMFLLGTHFDNTGRIEFLDEIVSFAGLDLVVKCQWIACNIAEAMRHRARLASPGAASALLRRAIHILTARHEHSSNTINQEKATILRELGAVYDLQAELGMDIDHDSRLRLARDAVALVRDTFEGRMEVTIGLVTVLLNQASRTASVSLANEAEDIIIDALKDEQMLDHLKVSLKALQAELQVVRFSIHDAIIDLSVAWNILEAIVTNTSARPRDRLRIAIRWATLAESIDVNPALLAYRHAVNILPQVGYIGEDLMGRVQALRQARDLAPRAASHALSIGDVKQAIELLEHSRGVLWQQSLHLRSPLHLLPPHLSSQLTDVSKTLDSSKMSSAERRQAADMFQSIVLEIRTEPGHEQFLLPRTYGQLAGRLPQGFVVWLIPNKTHCDIIMVDSRRRPQATHFRHAGLNLDRLHTIATAFTTVHASALRSIDRKTRPAPLPKNEGTSQSHESLLEELWSSLVQKVIRTLDVPVSNCQLLEKHICLMFYQSNKEGNRPRMWWCPIGPLTFLPLHAAGIYRGSGQECVADYVVSSYIPTVTSLVNANEARMSEPPSNNDVDGTQVLLVAQPDVQGLPSLPHAREEAAVVRSIVPEDAFINLENNSVGESTVQSVLARLPEASILHLACHATQCKDDPLQSGFDFADGRLTLFDLVRVHHPKAQLAYLSACESAAVDENQPDEAINLAATMLFVGFKSVIATMW
jgi:hypothetical protein